MLAELVGAEPDDREDAEEAQPEADRGGAARQHDRDGEDADVDGDEGRDEVRAAVARVVDGHGEHEHGDEVDGGEEVGRVHGPEVVAPTCRRPAADLCRPCVSVPERIGGVDGPLPLVLIYASLAFAAVVLLYVVLDRTPDWGLLGLAGLVELGTLVLLGVAVVAGRRRLPVGRRDGHALRLPRRRAGPAADRLRVVARRAQPRGHGGADGRGPGPGLRRRTRHAGVAVVTLDPLRRRSRPRRGLRRLRPRRDRPLARPAGHQGVRGAGRLHAVRASPRSSTSPPPSASPRSARPRAGWRGRPSASSWSACSRSAR